MLFLRFQKNGEKGSLLHMQTSPRTEEYINFADFIEQHSIQSFGRLGGVPYRRLYTCRHAIISLAYKSRPFFNDII